MAGITFYDAYFPTFIKAVDALESILLRTQTYAKENGIDADEYVSATLAADMNALPFQVQIASSMVKKCVNRLTGAAPEEWKDDETTFEQLIARAKRTAELVKSVRPEDINGREGEVINFQLGPFNKDMVTVNYVTCMVLPNLFFHVSTTYAILRMKGVPLGKMDYLTPFMGPYIS